MFLEESSDGVLVLGLILFLGMHSVSIINSQWRTDLVARFGEIPWKALYGLLALVGFYLIISGYGAARLSPVVIYEPPVWMRHINLLLMLPVFPLLLAAYLPGRIQSATKHPMLLAVKIWAVAHLLANGTLPDILLFGSFLAWAVADRISLKRRAPRPSTGRRRVKSTTPSRSSEASGFICSSCSGCTSS
jgi:uncharacterized membrane protein